MKTFSAESMAQALARVKRELGSDAVVLHTRSYKRGGLFGLGARTVVEVTAADGKQVGRVNRQKAQQSPRRQALASAATRRNGNGSGSGSGNGRASSRLPSIALPASPPPMPPMDAENHVAAGDLIKRTYAAAKAEVKAEFEYEQSNPAAGIVVGADAATASGTASEGVTFAAMPADQQQLTDEIQSVKRMVARMMHQQKKIVRPVSAVSSKGSSNSDAMPDALFDQYRLLLEQEVAEEIADEVVASVRECLSVEQLEDVEACRGAVLEAVTTLLPAACEVDEKAQGTAQSKAALKKSKLATRPRTIALIGPTGVGKTTTIAKLAANFKLKENKRVGLLTLDTYRIAAVEQLRTYAQIIGVPLGVVSSATELTDTLSTMTDCDIVLIDTAGRSQRNGERLDELNQILQTVCPDEVHLVLSSTATQAVLLDIVERFSIIRTDRVIFTKLDEAVTFGVLINVLKQVNKKLSYVTTGQEVPHQIEPGRSDHLAALVLGKVEVGG